MAEELKLNASDFTVESIDKEIEDHRKKRTINYLEDIGLLKEIKRLDLYQKETYCEISSDPKGAKPRLLNYLTDEKSNILKGYENYNVDVPAGYEFYIKTFKEMIEKRKQNTQLSREIEDSEYLFKVYNEEKKESLNIFQDKGKNQKGTKNTESHSQFIKQFPKKLSELGKEINLAIQPKKNTSYYYYKRWLWLIFPWACLSAEENLKYSSVMKQCYTNENKGMRVKDEQRYTSKALDISVQAKMKRMMILNSKKRDYLIEPSSLQDDKKTKMKKSTTRFRKTGLESETEMKRGVSERKFRSTSSAKFFGNKGSVSVKNLNIASTTIGPEELNQKDNIYLTGVNLLKKRGSTLSETGPQRSQILGEKAIKSTIDAQPMGNYFSNYDANLTNKFKIQKYDKYILKQFSSAKKRYNFNGLLKNLREAFEVKSQVEVDMMKQKNTSFMKALNQIISEK